MSRPIPLALTLTVAGLFGTSGAAADTSEGTTADLVVVALPAAADTAIIEALNRLRGEATSVGFEVRLVSSTADSLTLAQLESLWAGLRPAAVVAFARPTGEAQETHTLDVTFLDRGSGKATVAHLDAGDVADSQERADVIVAVRAVDFIRARMFDALVGRRSEPAPTPPAPKPPRARRFDLEAGLIVLGAPSGFSTALAPRLAVGYRPVRWLRVGAMAFGFGSESSRNTNVGEVGLQQLFIGAGATLLGPRWHRLQPSFELGGGKHWVVAQGYAEPPVVGKTVTLSSLGMSTTLGLAIELLPHLAVELRGGTLWLQSQARISATEDLYLGSVGRPLWFGSVGFGARF